MAKYYDSFLCMVIEEPTKVQDSIPVEGKKYTIHGHTFEVLKIKGENVSTKWDDGVTRILPFSYFEKAKAKDVNVRDGKNEYEIHYTIQGKNGTMVGSGRGSNEQEAKADFMAYHKSENPTITNIKLYKALDKAIRNCDAEMIVLPEISDTWRLIDKYNIKYTKNAGGIQIDVDEAVSKGANKEYIKKLSNMSKLYGRGDF